MAEIRVLPLASTFLRGALMSFALGLCACADPSNTLHINLIASPDSQLLSSLTRFELSAAGDELEFSLDQEDDSKLTLRWQGASISEGIVVRGFDSEGDAIATTSLPRLAYAGNNSEVRAFMAPPLSVSVSPETNTVPLWDSALAPLGYGILIAGGLQEGGTANNVQLYDALQHRLSALAPLSEARTQAVLLRDSQGRCFLVGGLNSDGLATTNIDAFYPGELNTNNEPTPLTPIPVEGGSYVNPRPNSARLGTDLFAISGTQAFLLDATIPAAVALPEGVNLDGVTLSSAGPEGIELLFVGANVRAGAALFRRGLELSLANHEETQRLFHAGITLPDGRMLVLGGEVNEALTLNALVLLPGEATFSSTPLLQIGRRDPKLVINGDVLAVIGGTAQDGNPIPEIELFNATTLDPIARILAIPRLGASVASLSSNHIAIIGGKDRSGQGVQEIELVNLTP